MKMLIQKQLPAAITSEITVSKIQLIEVTISAFLLWFTLSDNETANKNHLLNLYCLQKIQASETKQILFNVCNWK